MTRDGDEPADERSHGETARLLHELQVHQVELELRNEELLRSRAELEKMIVRYSDLYDFAPIAHLTLGPAAEIVHANLTVATLLGVDRSTLFGRPFKPFVAAADWPVLAEAIRKAVAAGRVTTCEVTLEVPDREGSAPLVEMTFSAALEREDCHAILVDITDRKRAEERLRSAQNVAAIGRLAGGIAHDFNNLLAVLMSHADVALGAIAADDPIRADLNIIKSVAERAGGLTRQLLAFSRRQPRPIETVDMNEIVTATARMLAAFLGESIELTVSLGPELCPVDAERSQLEQILLNLAVNARDSMPNGGKLELTTARRIVDGSSVGRYLGAAPGEYVLVSVKDTGSGMTPETMSKLFEPFFTTKEKDHGTGFGLSMVYGIVKQLKGDLDVRSEPGQGTTFEVYLPCSAGSVTPATEEPPKVDEVPSGQKILLVDDEKRLLTVTARLLEDLGFEVTTASDGVEALEVCGQRGGEIDLVLTDVMMPKMGGIELASRLGKAYPGMAILFMSGYAGVADAAELGIGMLSKPFGVDELRDKVLATLAKRRRAG